MLMRFAGFATHSTRQKKPGVRLPEARVSHDDLWSAQAKRYQRLHLEQLSLNVAKSSAKITGSI